MARSNFRPRTRALALEPRLLFDGAAAVAAADHLNGDVDGHPVTPARDTSAESTAKAAPDAGHAADAGAGAAATAAPTAAMTQALESIRNYLASASAADLLALFNGGQSDAGAERLAAVEALRQDILAGHFGVQVAASDNAGLQGRFAVFVADGPEGQPVILVNAGWLAARPGDAAIAQVLVEEVGHAIDARLNGHADTPGDEGQGFAAKVYGLNTPADFGSDDDHLQLSIDGKVFAAEAAASSFDANGNPIVFTGGTQIILSDLLDTPNLHERSGALARAWLRRTLLGWDEPDPEALPARQRRAMTAFALATWMYRAVVFLGIAVAVYLMFFKLLGIVLFAVEVVWFVARPVWSELSVWRKRWPQVRSSRRRAMAVLGLLAFPWAPDVSAPGVAHPERQQAVFSPFAARVAGLRPEGTVRQGEVLAQFEAPELLARETRTDATVQALQQRLAGLVADEQGMAQQRASVQRLREQLAEAQAIREEAGRLQIKAEFDGSWLDADALVRTGTWVGTRQPLGMLVDPRHWVVEAFVEQRQLERIRVGAKAHFRPQGHWLAVDATVLSVDSVRTSQLGHVLLDAHHGGPIATQARAAATRGGEQTTPVEALYRVRLALAEPLQSLHETRGQAAIEGTRMSLLWRALQRVASVAVREAGF